MLKRFRFLTLFAVAVAVGTLIVVAHAQIPGFNTGLLMTSPGVTISGGGGTLACVVGPSYTGSVPAGASAVGFNTCAVNFDFTNSSNFTVGGVTYNLGTVSTWLNCAGAATPLWTLQFGNCADIHIGTDGGSQVLQIDFTVADYTASGATGLTQIATPQAASWAWPNAAYIEVLYRTDTTSFNSATNADSYMNDLFQGNCCAADWQEWDFIEVYGKLASGVGNTASNQWSGTCSPCGEPSPTQILFPGITPTAYNTIGDRITQNSSGAIGMCGYLNGSQITPTGCTSFTFPTGGAGNSATRRNQFVAQSGPNGAVWTITQLLRAHIKHMTVFTCANWQSTLCTGTIDTGTP